MTVVVGIQCEDGVVLACDRQVTNSAFVPMTSPQPLQSSIQQITKVIPVGPDVLLAMSGNPSIGTEYESVLHKHNAAFGSRLLRVVVEKMKGEFRSVIDAHIQTAISAAQLPGGGHAYAEATIECLMAGAFRDGPRLLQIQRQGSFDLATSESPLRVIGSGQLHADPFLVFLKNTFWPTRLPTVQEGLIAACWTVEYAIEVGAPHVGGACNAFKLVKEGSKFVASQVSEDEMKGHKEFIATARGELRKLADLRHTKAAEGDQIPTMR